MCPPPSAGTEAPTGLRFPLFLEYRLTETMQQPTKRERRRERIRRSIRSQLARPFSDDWIKRRRRFDVHVYLDRDPPVVLIRGPRHIEDSELLAALSQHGYNEGDFLRTVDGNTRTTSARLFGTDRSKRR